MLEVTVGPLGTESERIILTYLLLRTVPKRAFSPTKLAEASLIVRAVLFGVRLPLDGMPEDARILLIALAILDEESTNWHLFRVKPVQVSALISLLARVAIPVNANFRLYLALVPLLDERGRVLLNLIKRKLL